MEELLLSAAASFRSMLLPYIAIPVAVTAAITSRWRVTLLIGALSGLALALYVIIFVGESAIPLITMLQMCVLGAVIGLGSGVIASALGTLVRSVVRRMFPAFGSQTTGRRLPFEKMDEL